MRYLSQLKNIVLSKVSLDVGVVFLGSIIFTGFGFLITTILIQKMTANNFGVYRLIIDTATVFFPLPLFGLQYTWNISIVGSNNNKQQSSKKGAIILLVGLITGMIVIITKVMIYPLSTLINIGQYRALLPFSYVICIPLLRETIEGVLVSQGKIFASALSIAIPQVITLFCLLIIPITYTLSEVVLVITVIVALSSTMILFLTGVNFYSIKEATLSILMANRNIGFPIYIGGIIALVARNIIQVYTGVKLDSIEYGSLSLAIMISGLLGLLPAAIGKAKFKDFATTRKIGNRVTFGALSIMVIGAGFLYLMTYIYILFIRKVEFLVLLQLVPLLLIVGLLRGSGDIINRFFYAKGNAAVLNKISIKVGGVNLLSGVILITIFGIWGVVMAKMVEAVIFLVLNSKEYFKYYSEK